MSPRDNIFYAIGQLAYAMANADGKIQKEEQKKFLDSCLSELGAGSEGPVISEIIFKLLKKQETFDTDSVYTLAMDTIRTNGHYLSPELKKRAIDLLQKVAEASPPFTKEERHLLERFKRDIEPIKGDPVFYGRQ
jgi:uncharacterized tellurite resistance protein B-like protein